MQKFFTKMLLPIAFNRNARWSVEKAVQLANRFECDLVLLHVDESYSGVSFLDNGMFGGMFKRSSAEEPATKLRELELQFKSKMNDGLFLTSLNLTGQWQPVLKDIIITEHIDLVVIPKARLQSNRGLIRKLNVNRILQQTNCPVMTITRNFNVGHLKNIVVPVHDLLPVKKLTMATYISRESSGCIYLVGDEMLAENNTNGYLIKSYQLLNELGRFNIHCALSYDQDMAAGTLAFAKDVKADLIVVNPGKESRLKGWWNRIRGKWLCRESDIPVLTVAP